MTKLEKYMIETINSQKPHIIEAFISIYGEKYREYITTRINKTKVYICHGDINENYLKGLNKSLKYNCSINLELNKKFEELLKIFNFVKEFDNKCNKAFKMVYKDIKLDTNVDYFIESMKVYASPDKKMSKIYINKRIKYFLNSISKSYSKENIEKYRPSKEELKIIEKEYLRLRYIKELAIDELKDNYLKIQDELIKQGFSDTKISKRKLDEKDSAYSCCLNNSILDNTVPVCLFNLLNLNSESENIYLHEFAHALDCREDNKCGVMVNSDYRMLNEAINEASIIPAYKYMLDHNYYFFNKNPIKESKSVYLPIIDIGIAFIEKFKDKMDVIKFSSKEELFKIIDKSTLSRWNSLCFEIMNTDQDDYKLDPYLDFIKTNLIKQIKDYTLDKQKY